MASPRTFSAAVIGGTGNVGQSLVRSLLADALVSRVVMFNRRSVPAYEGEARVQQVVLPALSVAEAAASAPQLEGVDALFITLGIGAPSKLTRDEAGRAELMRVDCDVPTAIAGAAKQAGVRHVSLLTAAGSDIDCTYSWVTGCSAGGGWYRHVKGRVEANIAALGLPETAIFRPAAIIGNAHLGGFGSWLFPKLDWMLPAKYCSCPQDDLAQAMVNHAMQRWQASASAPAAASAPEVIVAEGELLFALARGAPSP